MNNREIEKLLLLKQSGEISARQTKHLEKALANQPDQRAKAQELEALTALWADTTAATPLPRLTVMQQIQHQAATSCRQPRRALLSNVLAFPLPRLAPVWAAAAIMISTSLFVVVYTLRPEPAAVQTALFADTEDAFEAKLDQIAQTMQALLDGFTDGENPQEVEWDALAMQLMNMEGS